MNVYYKNHIERMRINICDLGKTDIILGILWLQAHNLEINWEIRKVKMMRYSPMCREGNQRKEKEKAKRKKREEVKRQAEKERQQKEKADQQAAVVQV